MKAIFFLGTEGSNSLVIDLPLPLGTRTIITFHDASRIVEDRAASEDLH